MYKGTALQRPWPPSVVTVIVTLTALVTTAAAAYRVAYTGMDVTGATSVVIASWVVVALSWLVSKMEPRQ